MPARGVVADVTRSARIGRKRRARFGESDKVAPRKGCPSAVGNEMAIRPPEARTAKFKMVYVTEHVL